MDVFNARFHLWSSQRSHNQLNDFYVFSEDEEWHFNINPKCNVTLHNLTEPQKLTENKYSHLDIL